MYIKQDDELLIRTNPDATIDAPKLKCFVIPAVVAAAAASFTAVAPATPALVAVDITGHDGRKRRHK